MRRSQHPPLTDWGFTMAANAQVGADNEETHKRDIKTGTSGSKSSVARTGANDQSIRMTDTADSSQSAGHSSSGNQNNIQQSTAITSNTFGPENARVEFPVAGATAGGQDDTQENREEAHFASASEPTAAEKGGTQERREEASSKSAAAFNVVGKGSTQDDREKTTSRPEAGNKRWSQELCNCCQRGGGLH
ncbi:hypothetical protein MRX96_001596 [Rhipicephalus microplus]